MIIQVHDLSVHLSSVQGQIWPLKESPAEQESGNDIVEQNFDALFAAFRVEGIVPVLSLPLLLRLKDRRLAEKKYLCHVSECSTR